MVENTRVPANTDAVDRARDVKAEHGDTWTDVMEFYAEHRDAEHHSEISVGVTPEVDEDALAELEERVDDAVSGAGGMDYDGAVEACRQAIREELPVEELRR